MTHKAESAPEAGLPAVEARYIEGELAEYRGNPYIEALPRVPSAKLLLSALAERPPYDEAERRLPKQLRAQCVLRLFHYFEPLSRHVDIGQRVDLLLRSAYLNRSPIQPAFRARLQEIYEHSQSKTYDISNLCTPMAGASLSLIGVSGIGKTRSLRRALAYYPQRIFHKELGLNQIPWIVVECPHDGTVGSLCTAFFQALDRVLGTNYAPKFGNARIAIAVRMLEVAQLARLHGVGLIVLDELQHLKPAGREGVEKMLNFIVTLNNLSEAALLFVGTMSAQSILQDDFRQARRGAGLGGLVWSRYDADDEWNYFVDGLWKYQWTQQKSPLTDEIRRVLYEETQGVVDLAIKLYMLAQYRAMASNAECIEPELLKEVAAQDFALLRPMLNALRSGDPLQIARYEDLRPLEIEQLLAREQLRMTEPIDIATLRRVAQEDRELRRHRTVAAMEALGIAPEKAQLAATVAFNADADLPATKALKRGLALVEGGRKRASKTRGATKPFDPATLEDADLRKVVHLGAERHGSAAAALMAAGIVTSPAQQFQM